MSELTTDNNVMQLLNSVRLARDNAERADNRIDHSFYYALSIALEELQEYRKATALAMRDDMREARTVTVKLPDSIPCPTAPEIIWLQTNGDDSDESKWPESDDDVSWYREKIFTNDTLYVRADLAAAGITLVVGE